MIRLTLSAGFLVFLAAASNESRGAEAVDFTRDIRPILSDQCFTCHGPDAKKRDADLRLDTEEGAIAVYDGHRAIDREHPEKSMLLERIFATDPDDVMPPSDSAKKLTAKQKEQLKRWVEAGAPWADHWSFTPPVKVADRNGVDAFIQTRLKREGLALSPEASREILIRRVTFDLSGLPPSPAEVDAFLADADTRGVDAAYETLVERLLASEHYGERMALAWLDAARYGDSSVMHADGPRDMWPWRDWVIRAYNANMPFDQFTIEQLAGDLLPGASVDQKVASGFNRNHATSDEGGAIPEELRVEYVVDRVHTTATVWLGLTMKCGQCHDHKYDPITQKEYYQFFSFFNNMSDPGMQTRKGNQAPVVEVVDPVRAGAVAAAKKRIEGSDAMLALHREKAGPAFEKWLAKASAERKAKPDAVSEPDGLDQWFPLGDSDKTGVKNLANGVTGSLVKGGKFAVADRDGKGKGLKFDGRTAYAFDSGLLDFEGDQPITFAAWLKVPGNAGGAVFSHMDVAKNFRGYDFWIQNRSVGTHIINTWPSNALKVFSVEQLKPNAWQHVVVTYDGSRKASGVKIYIDGKLAKNKVEADALKDTVKPDPGVQFKLGSRSNGANFSGEADDVRIYSRALTEPEVALAKNHPIGGILDTLPAKRTESQLALLREHFLASEDKGYQKLQAEHAKLAKVLSDLEQKPTTSMIMGDNPEDRMRLTYILERGHYESPNEEEVIRPGVPAALPPLSGDALPNRLGLARWLMTPGHPLTARVAVNRYWSMFFGEGLVRTLEDFGSQGAPPTHPELLDWLALDFSESGWDVKRMIRQLVLSRTYRQNSRIPPELAERDPSNTLLGRGPRFRLQGEFIRDQALAASGLLNRKIGGPGVKPYQPPNIWNEVSLNGGLRYPQDSGDKLYRRSLYTYWKRSAPIPNMLIFDAPSRETCVMRRPRTNTPLQALVTLNDPQFVEAGRVLAQRLIREGGNADAERIDLGFRLATARRATDREIGVLKGVLAAQRYRFEQAPGKAAELLGVGGMKRDESIDPVEHASWTVVAQMILNLDETLTRG